MSRLIEAHERAGIDGLVRAQARATPYAPAVVTERSALTYAALVAAVDRLDALTAQVPAVRQAGCIGLSFANPVTHLVATLFLLRLGKTQVTVPPQVPDQWVELLALSGVQCILCDHRNALPIDVPRAVIDPQSLFRSTVWPPAAACEIDPDAPALLVPGSGTTGRSRLIEYAHGGLLACIHRDQRFRPIGPGSRHLSVTNIGFYTAKRRALGCLVSGGTIVLREQPVNTIDLCDLVAVDHLSVVVMQAEDMVASLPPEPAVPRLPRLASLVVGSAPVSEALRRALAARITPHVWVTYGSNEFGEATCAPPDVWARHPGSVGRPLEGVEAGIVDAAGAPLPAGQTGRVRLRGAGMFTRYVGDPAATAAAVVDGWYLPGDLGTLTSDGVLLFQGRADDLMIFDGINIYPREIEAVLEAHPAVREAAAFPVASQRHTQIPVAAVVVSVPVSEADLVAWCRRQMGARAPHAIAMHASLPRNEAGKVLKRELAAGFARTVQ